MRDLAFHYESIRDTHPLSEIMIVFDIDGTVLDERYLVLSVLRSYDRRHSTSCFENLRAEDITSSPGELDSMLKDFGIGPGARRDILAWFFENLFTADSVKAAQVPCKGVLDVIRWFQLQERTVVGLNTSRPEALRRETLEILNGLGSRYRVGFESALMFMNQGMGAREAKVEGIRFFQSLGYVVAAVIDSDTANLEALQRYEGSRDILLVHSDLMWDRPHAEEARPWHPGNPCDITDLVREEDLPSSVEFAWHGVDEESVLRQFLVSPVNWAELHVRRHPTSGRLVLRRRSYAEVPLLPHEHCPELDDFLYLIFEAGRGVKLDLKDPGLAPPVVASLASMGYTEDRVWFSLSIEDAMRGGLRAICEAFPGAVKQCPVDPLWRSIMFAPHDARRRLHALSEAGIDRYSVDWNTPGSREIVVSLQNWGYEVNIYNVPDLESFLQAVLLLPASVTSYFNFPKWFYTGCADDFPQAYPRLAAMSA